MTLAARLLGGVAAAAAMGVALRAALGPFTVAGVRTASPLGLETVFGCALAGLWLTRGRTKPAFSTWNLPLAAALALVVIAFLPNLPDPFLSDDYILAARATFEPARLIALFHQPGGDGSFRPLGYVYFGLLRAVFGANSLAWHSVALIIHLLNCALLYFVVKTLWNSGPAAALVAALFGLHGSRPEAVAWSAGNFDLLACAFVFGALLSAVRGRVAAACVCTAMALLSKESAYATPLLILGFAIAGDRVRLARNALLGSTAVCAAMLAWRWMLFHGPGGYVDPATGRAQVLSFHWGSALKALLLRVWALMNFPIDWDAFTRSLPLALAILLAAAALLGAAPPARRVSVGLLAATVFALLPAYHLALIGQDLNGSRILYLPAAGFCVLCAHLARSQRWVAVALIAASLVMLRVNLAAWHENAALADEVCAGTTAQAPVHDRKGIVFFANGYAECRALKGR